MSEIFKKIQSMFPSWPMMVATLISLMLVIIFLTFLLYKPIKKALKERHDLIQSNIDQSNENRKISLEKLELANEQLKDAHKNADDIINDAKIKAEHVMNDYLSKAKTDAKKYIIDAELDIDNKRHALEKEANKYVVETAIELSRKIIQKEISKKTEEEIIDNFLKEE